MSNPEALTDVYYTVVNEVKNLSVDKIREIATMHGVMCEMVFDAIIAIEEMEKVTYEEFSDNPNDQECSAACQCGRS